MSASGLQYLGSWVYSLRNMQFKKSICGKFMLAYVFITTGTFINFLQLMTSPLGWMGLRQRQRYIVGKLTYLHWILVPAIAQWWSDIDVSVTAHPDDAIKFGNENAILLLNHKCQLDWIVTWIIANYYGIMQQIKAVAKRSLKYVPIVGWAFWLNEFILIRRNLESDKVIFKQSFDKYSTFLSKFWLLTFLEGTRLTPEKHRLGVKYAMENGLTPLKHHLVPRTKGFVLMTQGLRETVPAVYDATLCFRNRQDPKLVDYVSGNSHHADLVIRRIPMELVPGSEVDCSEFIHQIFKEKDDLVDYHLKNNCFPCQGPLLRDYVTKKIPKDKSALYIGFIWSTVQLGVLFYFLLVGLVTGTWIQITFTVLIIGAIFGMTNLILDSGTAKSSYGAESRKNK